MIEPVILRRQRLVRLVSVLLFLGTGVVLALAVWLEPASQGHSTHTQLGLYPCTMLSLTGFPCPMCGMTTTFALMADFRFLQAALNQPFGVLLFLATVVLFAISLLETVAPRQRWSRFFRWIYPHEGHLAIAVTVALLLSWCYKIALIRQW